LAIEKRVSPLESKRAYALTGRSTVEFSVPWSRGGKGVAGAPHCLEIESKKPTFDPDQRSITAIVEDWPGLWSGNHRRRVRLSVIPETPSVTKITGQCDDKRDADPV